MLTIPDDVIQFIKKHNSFHIFGHIEPDGDCIASQLALAGFLNRSGKNACVYSEGPFDRPEISDYKRCFKERPDAGLTEENVTEENAAAIIVDCSTRERLGRMADVALDMPSLVLDHHASGRLFGNVRWVEPSAPSTTYLIQHLIEALDTVNSEEARFLLFGLCTDTGFFRHLDNNSAPVFSAVSRLIAAGTSPHEVYRMIWGGWEMSKVKLLTRFLKRSERLFDGKFILTEQKLEDAADCGASDSRGSDDLYRILQCVKGCEVIAFIREEQNSICSVGLRSNNNFDVGSLASSLGGGGHKKAAGYHAKGSVREVKRKLISLIEDRLDELKYDR